MKRYTNHDQNATNLVNKASITEPSKGFSGPAPEAQGSVRIGTLKNTHIITNEWTAQHDRFLDICFKEWEQFLQDYYLLRLDRKLPPAFTPSQPIEFRKP